MLAYFSFCLLIVKAFAQVTLLSQSDFNKGTVRITSSGTYRLNSNIIVNPNSISDLSNANGNATSWLPNDPTLFPNDKNQAFSLGYFAAITIETNNVIIDLNGFSIIMHDHFYMQQRFFSIIDCNVPFESGTGPANFGSVKPIKDIVIMGPGKLGKSSHHGIHLNSVKNVVIKNLQIADFEVCGIQLNNFENAVIDNVEIGPSVTSLHNNVFYSNARFLLPKLKKLATRNGTSIVKFADRASTLTVINIYNNLIKAMNLFFKHVFVDGNVNIDTLTPSRQNVEVRKAYNLFANKDKFPDGASLYGIVLNSFGPSVFGFGDSPNNSSNITINNVYIHDLKNSIKEIIGYYTTNNNRTPVRGPFSDVVDMGTICFNQTENNVSTCSYKGNVLSDAQIALAMHGKSAFDETGLSSTTTAFKNWAQFGAKIATGNVRCGADVMTHTIKGLMAIRLDNIVDATISNTKIENIINHSALGSNLCGAYRTENDNFAVFGTYDGYAGTNSKGIIVTNSDNIMLTNIQINNLKSLYGNVNAINIQDNSNIIFNNNPNIIRNLNAGFSLTSNQVSFFKNNDFPNHYPRVCGVEYDDTSSIALIGSSNPNDHVSISNLQGYSPCNNEFQATNVVVNQP